MRDLRLSTSLLEPWQEQVIDQSDISITIIDQSENSIIATDQSESRITVSDQSENSIIVIDQSYCRTRAGSVKRDDSWSAEETLVSVVQRE